ncbi:MAG: hypothetical protein QOD77_588 [Thermoplasmata archaeon]|jgi:hypothetical protein|nr:hypothetical protein [Thermoplasmata archaeon]
MTFQEDGPDAYAPLGAEFARSTVRPSGNLSDSAVWWQGGAPVAYHVPVLAGTAAELVVMQNPGRVRLMTTELVLLPMLLLDVPMETRLPAGTPVAAWRSQVLEAKVGDTVRLAFHQTDDTGSTTTLAYTLDASPFPVRLEVSFACPAPSCRTGIVWPLFVGVWNRTEASQGDGPWQMPPLSPGLLEPVAAVTAGFGEVPPLDPGREESTLLEAMERGRTHPDVAAFLQAHPKWAFDLIQFVRAPFWESQWDLRIVDADGHDWIEFVTTSGPLPEPLAGPPVLSVKTGTFANPQPATVAAVVPADLLAGLLPRTCGTAPEEVRYIATLRYLRGSLVHATAEAGARTDGGFLVMAEENLPPCDRESSIVVYSADSRYRVGLSLGQSPI